MSKSRVYFTMALFVLANVVFLCTLLGGPATYRQEIISLESQAPVGAAARRVALHVGNFNFLNDFVAVDAVFLRTRILKLAEFPVTFSMIVKSRRGHRVETIFAEELSHRSIHFTPGASYSSRDQLWSHPIVDFVRLDFDVTFKFADPADTLAGLFVLSFMDTAHSLIELLVRLMVFFTGLAVLVYLVPLEKNRSPAAFQLRILTGLAGLVVVGSNPLYILSYFTESTILPTVDASVAIFLILATAVGFVVILETSRTKPDRMDLNWLVIQASPFFLTGFLYFTNIFFRSIQSSALRVLGFMKAAGATSCLLRTVIALMAFRPERPIEKMAMIGMISVSFLVSLVSELYTVVEPYIASTHEVQTFTFASVATFVFFMIRFYWPVDPKECLGDDMSSSEEKDGHQLEPMDAK
jgi:hypothetical protein